MKIIHKIMLFILVSFLVSCKSYLPQSNDLIYEVNRLTYSSDSGSNKLYYKTLSEPEISSFLELINLELWNNNLSKGLVKDGEVSYTDIFSKEDLVFFKEQLQRQKQARLDPRFLYNQKTLTKNKTGGTHQISLPVFNKNGNFILLLRNKIKGGKDLIVYKWEENKWNIYSVITLSMV